MEMALAGACILSLHDALPILAPLSSAIVALASELVTVTLVVAVLTTFQLASTALTTIPLAIAISADHTVDPPALVHVAVRVAATTPSNRICSFVTAPAFTVTL